MIDTTKEAKERFILATHCHGCKKELNRLIEPVVQDHSHFTGEFHRAAHQHCKLNLKIYKSTYKRPVLFHSLSGYDARLA